MENLETKLIKKFPDCEYMKGNFSTSCYRPTVWHSRNLPQAKIEVKQGPHSILSTAHELGHHMCREGLSDKLYNFDYQYTFDAEADAWVAGLKLLPKSTQKAKKTWEFAIDCLSTYAKKIGISKEDAGKILQERFEKQIYKTVKEPLWPDKPKRGRKAKQ